MRTLLLPALLLGALVAPAPATAELSPIEKMMVVMAANLSDALTLPGRPESAIALDESRKPAEVLGFLGLSSGMQAADLATGGGYWAELMARVVGPTGHVTAFQPIQFHSDKSKAAWDALLARQKGVSLQTHPLENFTAKPESYDFAIMNLTYHDLYTQSEKMKIPRMNPDDFVRALYVAMKPGGVVGIIDHVAKPGDTRAIAESIHRIDPGVVKADFERAGFVMEAESEILRNPDDDHEKLVFDPAVRGKTDRFLMKFRKPQ
ncbi:MAG: methyltransferase [Sphingobium sp. 32-64-5]|nr:MAG: methyltransferase [Sphingobium sp. 32-64-5]